MATLPQCSVLLQSTAIWMPRTSAVESPLSEVPQGWETARSKNTGKVYYINRWTRESQYEFPLEAPAWLDSGAIHHDGGEVLRQFRSGDTQFEFPDGPADGMEDESHAAGFGARRTVSKDKPLPPGWDTATSRSTNQKFYVNVVTGESQTEFPSAAALPDGWTWPRANRLVECTTQLITGEISYDLPSMPARTREDEIAEVCLVLCRLPDLLALNQAHSGRHKPRLKGLLTLTCSNSIAAA